MRKFHYFLMMLFIQLITFNVFAQTTSPHVEGLGNPLITEASQISSNASDEVEGKDLGVLIDNNSGTYWHSDWHGKVSEPHYLQFEVNDPLSDDYLVFYLQRRNVGGSSHLVCAEVLGSEDGENWDHLVTIDIPKPYASAEVLTEPIPLPKDKSYLHFRLVNIPQPGGPIFFHAAEIELYHVSEAYVVFYELNGIYMDYEEQIWDSGEGETMNIGTGFGQHSDLDSWKKFYELIQQVRTYVDKFMYESYDYNSDPDAPTLEQVQAMRADLNVLYKAILNSEVPYSLPKNGYYRIVSRLLYYTKVRDQDDNPLAIPERYYVEKAFFASYDPEHKDLGMYGTIRKDRANFLWKLTQNGDNIEIQNAGMDTYISMESASGVNRVIMTEDETQKSPVVFDWAGKEMVDYAEGGREKKDIFYIRLASQERNSNNYIHQASHGRGLDSGIDQELCFWKGTYDMGDPYYSDKGTSEWYLEYVPDGEAEALIEAFKPILNHDLLVESNKALRAEVAEALEVAKDPIKTALITSADQMSSPYSQNDCGGSRDGGDLSEGVLLDGNKDTYWHSAWSGNPPAGEHYILISDIEDMVGDCQLYICRRNTGVYHPIEIKLLGADNPEAADEEWEEMAVLPLGNAAAGQEYTTPAFHIDTPHKYVRIIPTQFTMENKTYWATSEIQIYKLTENPNSQFAAMGEVAQALDDVYNANVATADADLTVEMYEALLSAYQLFQGAMVDPTELRNALATYDGFTNIVVSGTEPGQWPSTEIATAYDNLYNEVKAYEKSGKYTAAQNHKYAVMLKAMSKSVMEQATGPKADTWYHIMFPTEEMFTDYGFDPSLVGGQSQLEGQAFQWGNYVVPGKKVTVDPVEEGESYTTHLEAVGAENIREGVSLYFMDKDEIEDPDASLFRFIACEADAADYTELISDVKENMSMAIDMSSSYTKGEPLIKDASQFSSNASDAVEGQHLEYLLDNNPSTFWHSDWHGASRAAHYLQVALIEPISGMIEVDVTRRQVSGGGHITRMYIYGSNDGENWNDVGYLELPYTNFDVPVTSVPVELGGTYKHLRFTLTHVTGLDQEFDPCAASEENKLGTEWTYFHVSEFQIYPIILKKELSPSVKALQDTYISANKILLKDVTAEDYATAAQAYKSYQTEFNAEIGKAVLPNGIDKTTPVYAIQNKATGLFLNAKDRNDANNTLELIPTFFNYKAVGYQRSLLHGWNIDGTDCVYLHSQNSDHRLVTWNDTRAEYNSGLILREAEDTETTEATDFTFYKDIKPGRIYNWCNSVAITNQGEGTAYSCVGRYKDSYGDDYLALKAIKTIPAGEPAFYIYQDTSWYDLEADDIEPMKFTIPAESELVTEGKTVNGLIGSIVKYTLKEHEIYFVGNHSVCIARAGYSVSGNRAILDIFACPEVDPEGDYDFSICLDEEAKKALGVEAIPTAIEKISKPGNVYSMDGKLLRTGATLNSLKTLGKGMYILNGVKVLVK